MDRILEKLTETCQQVSDDSRLRTILSSVLLTPLESEINSGKLDKCIALALFRVTLPLVLLILVLIVISIIQINTSMRLINARFTQ